MLGPSRTWPRAHGAADPRPSCSAGPCSRLSAHGSAEPVARDRGTAREWDQSPHSAYSLSPCRGRRFGVCGDARGRARYSSRRAPSRVCAPSARGANGEAISARLSRDDSWDSSARPTSYCSAVPRAHQREREILALIAGAGSNGDSAAEFVVSLKTVQNHVSNICHKLKV